MTTIVIGGDHVGPALVDRLRESGPVAFLHERPEAVERVRELGVDGRVVDARNRRDLETAACDDATAAVVATSEDAANLLIGQHLRTACEVDRVIVRVNDPRNREAFADRGFETVSTADALASALNAIVDDAEQSRDHTVVDSPQ